jgi:alkane 1-monooxygenase
MSFFQTRRPRTAHVNGRPIAVEPAETLLQAALRQGLEFPHSCRVGGCGTCRCRLLEGRVRPLTESSYVLLDEELAQGYVLACQSVPLTDVRVDVDLSRQPERRRVTRRAMERRQARTPAGVPQYLKFFSFHVIGLLSAAALLAGDASTTAGLLAIVCIYIVGDAICGTDTSTPRYQHPGILTGQLWLALPLLSFIVFSAVWGVSPGDPLGFGAALTRLTGHDAIAARDATTFGHHVSAGILTGLMIGMIGTITAHELTHRTWDPVSILVGRWLLAFSFDTTFSIEHVYGHHRYVSTEEDPATAPRGRHVYAHIVASTVKGNHSAWRIERSRLARLGAGPFSWRNVVLRGQLMSAALLAGAWAMGGWRAAVFFTLCGLWGKSLLEIVNYMEHYGMVRNPETPVHPRHSWNSNKRISSWTMFNLTRHSHHHAQGEVPYHDLEPLPDAPLMISGYLTTIVIALVPPLWHHLMTPRVLAWDRDFATDEERELAARANARSGLRGLRPHATAR